jgi:hypothetical protein
VFSFRPPFFAASLSFSETREDKLTQKGAPRCQGERGARPLRPTPQKWKRSEVSEGESFPLLFSARRPLFPFFLLPQKGCLFFDTKKKEEITGRPYYQVHCIHVLMVDELHYCLSVRVALPCDRERLLSSKQILGVGEANGGPP